MECVSRASFATVDEYLQQVSSPEARLALDHLRAVIREAVPEATECISYGIPSYKLKGYLVGFAAFKNHCSLFPGATVEQFAHRLEGYRVSKGTIQFKPSSPLPDDLVRDIIAHRVNDLENA